MLDWALVLLHFVGFLPGYTPELIESFAPNTFLVKFYHFDVNKVFLNPKLRDLNNIKYADKCPTF